MIWNRLLFIILATGIWHLVGRAGSPFIGPYPVLGFFMETVHALIYESHSSERCEKPEIKCIRKDPSVNTPSRVEHEWSIMNEISDEGYMRVIDLFDLPAYRCIENDSQFLQQYNTDFIIPGR
jgi:hypothetical protein